MDQDSNKRRFQSNDLAFEKLELRNLLATSPFSSENLLANGTFDQFTNYDGPRLYSSAELGGWQTNGDLRTPALDVRPNELGYELHLDSSSQRSDHIYQNIATDAGETYLFTFDYLASACSLNEHTHDFEILWDNQPVAYHTATYIQQTGGIILEGARHGSTRLEIREVVSEKQPSGDGIGPVLDSLFVQEWDEAPIVDDGFESLGSSEWNVVGEATEIEQHQRDAAWAAEGDHVLQVDASDHSFDQLLRNFRLEENQTYLLSFDVIGSSSADAYANQLEIGWNDQNVATVQGASHWARHFIIVTADDLGRGSLMFSEVPNGENQTGNGLGPYIDGLHLHLLATNESYEFQNATINSFQISSHNVAPGDEVTLSWSASGFDDFWIELWHADQSSAIETTGLFQPLGSVNGNIHSIDSSGNGISPSISEWNVTIPALPTGDYKFKLVGWQPGHQAQDAKKAFIDFSVSNNRSPFAAFVYDQHVSSGQDLVVTWRIDENILPIDIPDDSTLTFISNGLSAFELNGSSVTQVSFDLSDTQIMNGGEISWFPDGALRSNGTTVNFHKGFTSLPLSSDINNGDAFDLRVRIDLANGTQFSTVPINVTVNQSSWSNPSAHIDATTRVEFENRADELQEAADDNSGLVNDFIVDQLAIAKLELDNAYNSNDFASSLNSAFGGHAFIYGNWNPNKETTILVHGVNTPMASQFQFGQEIASVLESSQNVIAFHWDLVDSGFGATRRISDIVPDATGLDSNEGVIVSGSARLSAVFDFVSRQYSDAGATPDGKVNTISHSQGTILTSMAIPLSDSAIIGGIWNDAIFAGGNIERDSTEVNQSLDEIFSRLAPEVFISNLHSVHDSTVDLGWGPTEGSGQRGFTAELTNVRNFDATNSNIAIFENSSDIRFAQPEIVHCSSDEFWANVGGCTDNLHPEDWTLANQDEGGGEIAVLQWLVEVEASRDFLTFGLGDGFSNFGDYLEGLISGDLQPFPIGPSNNPNSTPQSPTLDGVGFGGNSSLTGSDEIERGDILVAEALNPEDPDGFISRADFFFDANENGIGEHWEYLGSDYSSRNGWKEVVSTRNMPLGEVTILGIVFDNDNNRSFTRSNQFTIIDPNGPPPELPESLTTPREIDYHIVPHRNGDIYYSDARYVLQSGRVDYWVISPRTGGFFNFETYGTTDTVIGIYDYVTGDLLDFDEDNGNGENAELRYELASETAYVLALVAQNGSEGRYDFEVRSVSQSYTDTYDVQPPTYIETLSDSISTTFGFDFFKVDAPLTATSVNIRLTPDETLDGWIRIENENYETVATSYLAPTGQDDVLIDVPVNGGETYRIAVSSIQETSGFFDLEVDFNPDESGLPAEVDPWPNAIPLIPLHNGDRLMTGMSIEDVNEFDFYYVTTNAPNSNGTTTYTFETFGNLDTQLGVYRSYDEFGSDFVFGDDDSGAGQNASVTIDLENGERYVILVRSDNMETGQYDLRMQRPPEDVITEISINGLESKGAGDIDISANSERYHLFKTTAPDNATELDVVADLTNANTDISLRVHTSDGEILYLVNDAGVSGDEQILSIPVVGGEEYYFTVNNLNFETHGSNPTLYLDFNPNFDPEPGIEFVVNTTTYERQEWPVAERNPQGNTVVAWQGIRSDAVFDYDIFFQMLDINNQPLRPEVRIQSAADNIDQFRPFISMVDSGEFVIGWSDENGDAWFQRYDANGDTVGTAKNLGFTATAIALRDDGIIMAVGRVNNIPGSGDPLRARLFNNNNTPRTPIFDVDRTTDEKELPQIQVDNKGRFVVAWRAQADAENATNFQEPSVIYFAVYDQSGIQIDTRDRTNRFGELHGTWFNDLNTNGGFDEGETVIAGKELFVDLNNNGQPDSGEPRAITDNNGIYAFHNLTPGFYSVLAVDGSTGGPTTVADSFDRADSTDLGADWLEVEGDFRIEGGKLRSPVDDRSKAVYLPHAAGSLRNQTVVIDVEYDPNLTYQNGLFEIGFGYENPETSINFYLFASPTNGPAEFSRIRFFDTRNRFGDWQRMLGGVEYGDITPFTSARLTAALDHHLQTITIGFDTNFDGVNEFYASRGGVNVEELGEQIMIGANGNVGIDNVQIKNELRNVSTEEIVSDFALPMAEFQSGQFPVQQDADFDISSDGNIFVAFEHRNLDTNVRNVYATQLDSDFNQVLDIFQVNSSATNTSWGGIRPHVAAFDQGRFLVSWENNDDGLNSVGIAGQKIGPNGQMVGPEFQINQHLEGRQKWVDLASDGTGSAFVAWTAGGQGFGVDDQDGSVEGIVGREVAFDSINEPELDVQDSQGTSDDRYIDFQTRPLGGAIGSQIFEIVNSGNFDLVVSNLELIGDTAGVFSVSGPSNFTLIPGTIQQFTVTFDPFVEGEFLASIRFEHNDDQDSLSGDFDESPHWISLKGKAEGDPRLEVEVIPGTIREDAGDAAGSVVVRRVNGDHSDALTVVLASSDTTEAQVPVTATIPAGESTVVVPINAIDDFEDDGTQIPIIFATATGYDPGSAVLNVLSVNHSPSLDAIPDQTTLPGQLFSYTAIAFDPDVPADNLAFTLIDPPSGATIDSITGEITWTPDSTGLFTFTVEVADDGVPSLTAEQAFTVSVLSTPPEGIKLLDGLVNSGQISDLFSGNDQYLKLDPSPTTNPFKQKVDLISQSTSSTGTPTEFRFLLEAKMLGGPAGDVMQSIEMFNYHTRQFELVDVRPASASDLLVEVVPSGDLTRFVHAGTYEVTARVQWQSESFAGVPFDWTIDVDQFLWLIL